MRKIRSIWRNAFDVREGEALRVTFMALYLMFVLFAYYILKPVSRAMFLNKFDIDQLPYLYILIAAAGGLFAYVYTKIAVRTSLRTAVTGATIFVTAWLILIWYWLGTPKDWMLYVFNVFVSLFSITMVSQGWLVAANIFTTQEAKRLYGILGVGSVLGAAFGGTFTAFAVKYIGSRNLLLASAGMVLLAYLAFLATIAQKGVSLRAARGAEDEESFEFKDLVGAIARYRHLQVIIGIIAITYIVDVMVEFQFSAEAKEAFQSQAQLTAFLGSFYGIWLNLVTFVLQFFLTAFVVSHFGVGGALLIMPVTIGVASVGTFLLPTVQTTAAARLTEAATRYSFNRTGMELLYLPLPTELKNRTKAFVDIFVDRLSRGIGGIILAVLTAKLAWETHYFSLTVIALSAVWILLSIRARKEYISTVRKRLESRRLDLDSLRVNVREGGTIKLLEEAVASPVPRQAVYALSLLAEAPGYPLERQLVRLADSTSPELRAKVYEAARERKFPDLLEKALAEIRGSRSGDDTAVLQSAVHYALAVSPEAADLAGRLLEHPNAIVSQAAAEALVQNRDAAPEMLTKDWIEQSAASSDSGRRTLAGIALRLYADEMSSVLHKLLLDADPAVAAAAMRTASALQNRSFLEPLIRRLANARMRRVAIEALAAYGEKIVGTLGDVLMDGTTPPAIRRQIPRVLQRIPSQRTVDVLLGALAEPELTARAAVLKGLNNLRENQPNLNYGGDSVLQRILGEARYYYEMNAALSPLRQNGNKPASRLLILTLQDRLRGSLERLFRLMGLRYPPMEIYAAYLAVNRKKSEHYTTALDFLDNVLEREVKKVVMPLLDDEIRITQSGRDLFGVEPKDAQSALRDLINCGDPWLVSCAIATAAELRLNQLLPEITSFSERGGAEVGPVARSAIAVLT